ncbi:alkaline phosphatase [Methylomarinum sp. Ch1-1]|uniref:Alkaline phosphatase n=1 Tax=Methylomarinum roseum TaxID=3067653 RepID=A0AAU7NQC8_9GAMM|nr:alkaline phosphatase [Methylomarinum sp. Ch1-1]MDP4520898.1 alkaline phosphatase [Methylomarinum sp. Ch1-1]
MKRLLIFIAISYGLLLTACSQPLVKQDRQVRQPVKNLILMIGDGMGPQQLGLLREYARRAQSSRYLAQNGKTAFDRFAEQGLVGLSSNGPADALVVDSACSASQLASGISSNSEMIGLDQWGNPVETILEKAKQQGKATGLVSDTRITHATPAAFASHQRHRSLENAIADEMLSGNQVDVMLSGGLRHWLPQSVNTMAETRAAIARLIDEPAIELVSARRDQHNLLEQARRQGYALAFNRRQLQQAKGGKIVGLFASSAMQDALDDHHRRNPHQPSLAEMTKKALEGLEQNPNGFFLMVEGGQIDWAGHNNDAGELLHEMIRFEQAVAAVFAWAKHRQDTLVIITADHETGGFGFSYSRYRVPEAKPLPGAAFAEHLYQPNFNFADPVVLDRLYAQKKSFYQIWRQAKGERAAPDADSLLAAINANSAYKIDKLAAGRILEKEANAYYRPGHRYLKAKQFPKVDDFEEFYVYGDGVHLDLIGRALAKQQNIVWATGTHTHTPVPVIAWGPERHVRRFSTLSHHTEIGLWMMEALTSQ